MNQESSRTLPIQSAALLPLLLLLAIGCNEKAVSTTVSAPVVTAVRVAQRELSIGIRATGQLQAIEHAKISAEVAGTVTRLLRDEGDTVDAGEIVLAIDPERRELEVASAEAAVAESEAAQQEATREHRRLLKLHTEGAASSARLESAATTLEAANSRLGAGNASLGMAKRSLSDAKVAAPFPGVIARRHINRGEFVSPGTPLFELVSGDPLEVIFHLSEVDSSRVALGNPVTLGVAAYPKERFTAQVSFIAPRIDMRSRTLRVKAKIENPDGRLRPGLFTHIHLGVEVRHDVLMIPEECILQRASGPIVFVIASDDHVERRTVRTGLHRGGDVEVVDGLLVGERVINQGHLRLVDGMLVKLIDRDEANGEDAVAQAGLAEARPQ